MIKMHKIYLHTNQIRSKARRVAWNHTMLLFYQCMWHMTRNGQGNALPVIHVAADKWDHGSPGHSPHSNIVCCK